MSDLEGSYNIIGPPGCGKTTFIAKQTQKIVEDHGPDSVVIASLTRAAAAEVAGRNLRIPRSQIGTLHAMCYRALGNPEIAESKIDQWNQEARDRNWQMTAGAGENVDDSFPEQAGKMPGDKLLQEANLYRVRMIPKENWDPKVLYFFNQWEAFKNGNSYYDFTDLISYCLSDVDSCPGGPTHLIVDEAQDMDLLAVALVRKWSGKCQATLYAGDAWQCQPPGTMVMTRMGYVAIEKLDVNIHRLMSYKIGSEFISPIEYPYWIKEEKYNGPLYTVEAGGFRTSGTDDHLWVIRTIRNGLASIVVEKSSDLPTTGFEVPVTTSKKGTRVEWVPARVTSSVYSGPIFSLRVEPYHTYVADGIVTHNCIYSWRGSDPNALDYISDPSHIKVLKQSYRLPRAVHEYATRWMSKSLSNYKPLEFNPREEEGSVEKVSLNYMQPKAIASLAGEYSAQGKRVMILGACSYHVYDIVQALKHLGIPFHNPFRRRRGDWNPLHASKGTSMAEKILSFLKASPLVFTEKDGYAYDRNIPRWTVEDLQNFVSLLEAKNVLKRGAKKQIESTNVDYKLTWDDISMWFTDDSVVQMRRANVDWLYSNMLHMKKKMADFPVKIIRDRGELALKHAAQKNKDLEGMVIPGTIHSVKGGEAEVVILLPDISPIAHHGRIQAKNDDPSIRDALARLFYVGITRAKEKLIILEPGSDYSVQMPGPGDI